MTCASHVLALIGRPVGNGAAHMAHRQKRRACFAALWFVLGMALATAAVALQPGRGIAIIYPDIGEPYRSVFSKIIEGIEDQAKSHVPSFAVGTDANVHDIADELRRQDIHIVIALGRNGMKAAAGLERDIHIVTGGVISIPEAKANNIEVFSLAPDPALLFARLQDFMPAAKRVFVVYDPRQNAWLMRLARDAAASRNLVLIAYEAQDLKTAVRLYQEILATADAKKDALWLLQDSTTVDEGVVLPLVLQEAWSHNLMLFSSNAAHVRRGALFSLYPNNLEIGRSLANSALGYTVSAGQHAPRGINPLKAVSIAVNLRTASHLGLNIEDKQSFDLVFPEP